MSSYSRHSSASRSVLIVSLSCVVVALASAAVVELKVVVRVVMGVIVGAEDARETVNIDSSEDKWEELFN